MRKPHKILPLNIAKNIEYDPKLPIVSFSREIVSLLKKERVLIIAGETGSGKTTQIPKFCLEAGIDGLIGCTQPRRIAATTVAARIAQELKVTLGEEVGYKIRFKDLTGPGTIIKVMTDGILLAETLSDHLLSRYRAIIVDEAHERSLNIDFILGFLKTLLKKRDDLKVIVTSATIDTEKFSEFFCNAPVIDVTGRRYSVDLFFSEGRDAEKEEEWYVARACDMVVSICRNTGYGDILVFMPTEQDIRDSIEILRGKKIKGSLVLPLFARLGTKLQKRVFARTSERKIIISTNIAETSVTIPGIRFVVDTGLARILRYLPGSRTTALPVVEISRSSADQRMGRCGRVENGICYRLYSRSDYESRPLFTEPEILRSNLAGVILRMMALRLGKIEDFPFVDRPGPGQIKEGLKTLLELGAIREKKGGGTSYELTKKGRRMARIPLDPRLSAMLIEASNQGCVLETAVIAASLSVPDPRQRPLDNIEAAEQRHKRFEEPGSDFLTPLRIWHAYSSIFKRRMSRSRKFKEARAFCEKNFLAFNRMREWQDIFHQVRTILSEMRMPLSSSGIFEDFALNRKAGREAYKKIHTAILSGFLSHIARKKEKNIYFAPGGQQVMIFPGSSLFAKPPAFIVAADFVETKKRYARIVAQVDPEWILSAAGGLVKFSYTNERFEPGRGEVAADRTSSLFGIVLESGKTVSYGRINPKKAFKIFITEALTGFKAIDHLPFLEHNLRTIESVGDLEKRLRKRDILISEKEMISFYEKRLPLLSSVAELKKVLKKRGSDSFLRMRREDLMNYLPDETTLSLFPEYMDLAGERFKVSYEFDPASEKDGATLIVPFSSRHKVPAELLDWPVPGLVLEKIEALLRGLPKSIRKRLVPVLDTAGELFKLFPETPERSFITTLAESIKKRFGLVIPAHLFTAVKLPWHLVMRISIVDVNGYELASGRDPSILKMGIKQEAGDEIRLLNRKLEKKRYTGWDFEDIDEEVILERPAGNIILFPGLSRTKKDNKGPNHVAIRLFSNPVEAGKSHAKAVCALYENLFSRTLKQLKKAARIPPELKSAAKFMGGAKLLEESLYNRVTCDLLEKNIRSKEAFLKYARQVEPKILSAGKSLLERAIPVIEEYSMFNLMLGDLYRKNLKNRKAAELLNRIKKETSALIPPGFIKLYSLSAMDNLPRYIKAAGIRAERGVLNLGRVIEKEEKIIPYTSALTRILGELTDLCSDEKRAAIERLFWMIEEFKVSIFAQELKTPFPVSEKILNSMVEEIEGMT